MFARGKRFFRCFRLFTFDFCTQVTFELSQWNYGTSALWHSCKDEITMKKIFVIPVGPVKKVLLGYVTKEIQKFLPLRAEKGQEIPMPEGSFNARRGQYHSSVILRKLEAIKRRGGYGRVIGITTEDLYVPQLNFVFGEAGVMAGVAVISICRLRQEFYGLKADSPLLHLRALKEVVHELGHTCGLDHCPNNQCIMYFSNDIGDTDGKGPGFCKDCKETLGI